MTLSIVLIMAIIFLSFLGSYFREHELLLEVVKILSIISIFFLITIFDKDYKEGQIDAINGKIKYELKENSDKTKTWVKKEGI